MSRIRAQLTIRPGVLTPRQKLLALRNVGILVIGAVLIVYPMVVRNERLVAAGIAVSSLGVLMSGVYFILRTTKVLAALYLMAAGALGLLYLYLPGPRAQHDLCALGTFAFMLLASRTYFENEPRRR